MTEYSHIKAQLDEMTGTEAYQWLLGEINTDANNVLALLATEPDPMNMRYKQGEIYGMKLAAELLASPWKRLNKVAALKTAQK